MTPNTILIIDHDPDVLELLSLNLEFHGYTCVCTQDLTEALTALENTSPSLIVLGFGIHPYDRDLWQRSLKSCGRNLPSVLSLSLHAHDDLSSSFLEQVRVFAQPHSTHQLAHSASVSLSACAC